MQTLTDAVVAAALQHLRQTDPVLAQVIARVGPFGLKPRRGRFEALVRSILAQQISTAVARTLLKRLKAHVAPQRITPDSLSALSLDELRSLGLSRQKASYLHDLAARVSDGSVRLDRMSRMSNEDVIAALLPVKGIGRWTGQMFLMFCLGRADVFAPDDFGLRSAIQQLYGLPELPKRAESEAIACAWQPYSTVACWYLWRSLDS